jgi:uncharacterized LabA/DUF88 family protein
MTARAAGRRSKSCMSEFLWTLLLCGLLTDADMNRLRNRYLSPRRNRVAPRQFVARATELVLPSWVPLDRLEAFLEDIARGHPPEPLLSRDDADRDLRAPLEAHPGAPLRIGLVADCANLYFGAASWKGRHVDMARLKETLGRGGQVVSAVAFAVQPRHADATSYFDALRFAGWHVEARVGKPAGEAGERWKSNWDVGITLHVVRQAPVTDVLGIATGDGDFADLLRWLRARGIRSRVASLPGVASHILREEAEEFIEIDESMLLSESA